ncbi:hypothetical protein [Pseudomonas yamanorum]|uniref:hypothetical protein n=1 Tax=Pseudomonas yamanorum TaxID=515393 RepID=UPI0015A31C97|nr:hypothetical protein [Pseudomonas yamanorum]
MISSSRVIPLHQLPVNSGPVPLSANQPTVSEPGSSSASDAKPVDSRAEGDSELARLYGNTLLRTNGMSSHDRGLMIDNIPPSSTFGQWWAQLGRALQSPQVAEWMKSARLDKSTLTITPGSNQVSFKTTRSLTSSPSLQTRGPQDKDWANVSGPVMAAGLIVANGYSFASFKPPLSENSNSAPLWLVKRFYKELEQSPAETHQRAKQILADEAFHTLDEPYFEGLHESRSEDELATQKTALASLYDNQNLGNEFKYLADQQVENGYWEGRIPQYLEQTLLIARSDSPYANESSPCLKQIIDDNGWDIPTHREQLENLSKYLLRPEPSAPEHGNNGGALAWPTPLDHQSRLQLEADLHYGKFGDIDVSAFKNVLEYLMQGNTFSQSELRNPQQLLKTLIDSPKGQALGLAIQAKFEARSVKGSVEDWLLAAMNMDGYVGSGPQRRPVTVISGFDLMDKETWGKPAPVIFKHIVDFMVRTGEASSPEKASILAHVLLSNRAPEYLVKDIPDTVVPGSHSWVSFVTAVGRIEAKTPGATAGMSYGQIMLYASVAPISLKGRQVEYAAQENALKHWGIINGMASDTPERMTRVREAFSAQISELQKASEAYRTPMPDLQLMALTELKECLPHMTESQLQEKCITLVLGDTGRPGNYDFPGPYSVLDLYMKDRLFDLPSMELTEIDESKRSPNLNKWVSSSAAVDIDDVLKKASGRPHILPAFKEALSAYIEGIENATRAQVKLLISQLPYEDRENLEYGKITVAKEFDVLKDNVGRETRTRMKPNTLVVKTQLKNRPVTTYEINLQTSKITKREDFKDFKVGRQPTDSTYIFREFDEVKTRKYSEGETDEKTITGAYLNSSNSTRTTYIAQALLDDLDIKGLYDQAWGSTTLDTEVPAYKKVQEFLLDLIPGRSAIKNFMAGNYGDGIVDLTLDVFGFVMGLGAAAKATKALAAGASALAKAGRVLKIVGRAAIGALNPLDGAADIGRGIATLGRTGFNKGENFFRTLARSADNYDLVKASKRFDSSSFGTFKLDNQFLEGPAILQNGKWHHYNPVSKQAYGPALKDFLPSARIDTEDFGKWATADGVTRKVDEAIVSNWKNTINAHRRGPDKDAFEQGYLSGNPQTIAGFSNKMKAADIMKLAGNKNLTAEQAGMLLKKYDDIAYEFGRSGSARFIDNIEPRFGNVIPMPQVVYFSQTGQLSDGQCAALSRAMATAVSEGKDQTLLTNMFTAAAFPKAPASREFIARLSRLQTQVGARSAFHAGQPTRQLSIQNMVQELADATVSKSVMIDSPGHAMAAGVKVDGTHRSYYFYDPNHGIANFQSAEDMKKGLERISRDKKLKPQYKTHSTDPNKLEFKVFDHDDAWQQKNSVFSPDVKKLYDTPITPPGVAPLSHVELKTKWELLHKAPGNQGLVCYEASVRIGQAEKNLSDDVFAAVKASTNRQGGSNYSPRYLELMGIKPDALKTTFNPADITESGLLNFKHANEGGEFGHTVYIQKTADNELYLFNTNSPDLDVAMVRAGNPPVVSGGMTVYHLGNGKDKGLQRFLDGIDGKPGWQFAYTPASTLNTNVKSLNA